MSSTSESGHVKNVANMEELVSSATGYEETFNPPKEALKIPALLAVIVNGKNAINGVNAALPAYKKAVAARLSAFAPLSKLVTRILSFLKATDVNDKINEIASGYARKIQGRRVSAKRTEEEKKADAAAGKEFVEISASQMSYDSRLDNFDKLIKFLSEVELYTPNEADLKITALKALYEDLKIKNSFVVTVATPLNNARILRNDILYKPNTGLVDIAQDVKSYIKSIFGASSPQYKQVAKLEFSRVRA